MNALEENRKIIDEVDTELCRLFQKRFAAVEEIMRYKLENGMQVLDRSREAQLIARRRQEVPPNLQPYFQEFYEALLSSSRHYQSDRMQEEAAKTSDADHSEG